MTNKPVDLDKHRGMAAQRATDLRRALAEVESNVRELREREADLESRMMAAPATSWPNTRSRPREGRAVIRRAIVDEDQLEGLFLSRQRDQRVRQEIRFIVERHDDRPPHDAASDPGVRDKARP